MQNCVGFIIWITADGLKHLTHFSYIGIEPASYMQHQYAGCNSNLNIKYSYTKYTI